MTNDAMTTSNLTREKMVAYHECYAAAMTKYGLQRGVRFSETRHTINTIVS